MNSVIEIVNKIKEIAISNQNNPVLRVIQVPVMKPGYCYRQGDLYIFKVDDGHPVGEQLDIRQLAEGTSIGQRHVLLGNFKVYKGTTLPKLAKGKFKDLNIRSGALGYAFDVLPSESGELDTRNGHPEHAHFVFNQTGRFQVWHQMDFQTLERTKD